MLKVVVDTDDSGPVSDFLAKRTGISRSKVKDAMNKGAVWLKKRRGKQNRIRRATTVLKPGDQISFNYDENLLAF